MVLRNNPNAVKLHNSQGSVYIGITTSDGKHYAQLTVKGKKIHLGRYDGCNPTELLDLSLKAIPALNLWEIRALLRADKRMREPNRRPGRPKKARR